MKLADINLDFKPQFGNSQHIKICDLISKCNEYEKKYRLALKEARSAKTMKAKRDELMSKVQQLVAQQMK